MDGKVDNTVLVKLRETLDANLELYEQVALLTAQNQVLSNKLIASSFISRNVLEYILNNTDWGIIDLNKETKNFYDRIS